MIILGIDPGTATTGFGIIRVEGNKFSVLEYGVLRTKSSLHLSKRLRQIYDNIEILIDKYNPEQMAVEELFFNKNTKTALSVGHARGVVLLAAEKKAMQMTSYTPLQVKQAVVGYGKASKSQVQKMVKNILGLNEIPNPDDAADALAISICHAHSNKINEIISYR